MICYYDLDLLLPQKPQRKGNGRFAKGHTPHNKGKKWSEWMDGRKQRKVRNRLVHTGRPDIGGWNKKPIIATDKDGKEYWFDSASSAATTLGLIRRNVSHCANGKRPTCHGWRFRWTNSIQH